MENCLSTNLCGVFYILSILGMSLVAAALLVGALSLHEKTKRFFPFEWKTILSAYLFILGIRVFYRIITIHFM